MSIINSILNTLFDLLLRPFQTASPWIGLSVASLVTAAVLVGLFAVTSNPFAILRARNKFLARTFELLLFQHDLRVSLSACGRILAANFDYLFQLLFPMFVGLIPLVLIFIQLEAWFERRPLQVGEQTVLTVQVDPAHPVATTAVELALPNNARLDSPPVRTPKSNEVAWRLIAAEPGTASATVTVAGSSEQKSITVGSDLARLSTRRVSSGWTEPILAPSEPALNSSGSIRRISLSYPARVLEIGTTEIHWLWGALGLMMAFSLILGQLFGVRIA